jgi:hypothetical protein
MEVNCNSAAQVGVGSIFFDSWGHENGTGVSVLGVVESSGSYGVLPRRPYVVGQDARQNPERVKEGVTSTQVYNPGRGYNLYYDVVEAGQGGDNAYVKPR